MQLKSHAERRCLLGVLIRHITRGARLHKEGEQRRCGVAAVRLVFMHPALHGPRQTPSDSAIRETSVRPKCMTTRHVSPHLGQRG